MQSNPYTSHTLHHFSLPCSSPCSSFKSISSPCRNTMQSSSSRVLQYNCVHTNIGSSTQIIENVTILVILFTICFPMQLQCQPQSFTLHHILNFPTNDIKVSMSSLVQPSQYTGSQVPCCTWCLFRATCLNAFSSSLVAHISDFLISSTHTSYKLSYTKILYALSETETLLRSVFPLLFW